MDLIAKIIYSTEDEPWISIVIANHVDTTSVVLVDTDINYLLLIVRM